MQQKQLTRTNSQHGFTLIELLVVLVILGLLAGLVGPQVLRYTGSAKSDTAKLQIEELGAGLDLFHLEIGRYPTTAGRTQGPGRTAHRYKHMERAVSEEKEHSRGPLGQRLSLPLAR